MYKQHGIPLKRASIMAAFGCNFEGEIPHQRVLDLMQQLLDIAAEHGVKPQVFSLADTMAWATPKSIRELVGKVRDRFPDLTLSLHLHDTRGMGIANAYAGLEMGVAIFDSTVAGLGGCPFAAHKGAAGNVCTEDLVFMLDEMGIETGIDLDKLIEVAHLAEDIVGHPLPGSVKMGGSLKACARSCTDYTAEENHTCRLTKTLGQFVADLSPNRLPEEAVRVARLGFIDCIGTMIAGRNEDCVRIMKQVLAPADGPATLTFGAAKAPAPEAAWINGTAAHALDYDDVASARPSQHRAGAGDPGRGRDARLVRRRHDRRLCRRLRDLGRTVPPRYRPAAQEGLAPDRPLRRGRRRRGLRHRCAGWMPTRPRMAIALGASQSAGLMANFGTMTKPFHAGKAAHAGIMAARLAEAGFTASTDALEHPQGFLHAISPDRHRGPHQRGEARRGLGDPDAGPGHQEIPHLLLHASRDRLHARPGERDSPIKAGRSEEDHRQHQRLFRHRAAQPPAATPASPRSSAWSSPWRAASSPSASACAN